MTNLLHPKETAKPTLEQRLQTVELQVRNLKTSTWRTIGALLLILIVVGYLGYAPTDVDLIQCQIDNLKKDVTLFEVRRGK